MCWRITSRDLLQQLPHTVLWHLTSRCWPAGFRVFISHTNWSADRRERGNIYCSRLTSWNLPNPAHHSFLLNRRSNSVFVCLWCPVADVNVFDTSAVNSLVILFLLSAHQMVLKQLYFCDEFIHIYINSSSCGEVCVCVCVFVRACVRVCVCCKK